MCVAVPGQVVSIDPPSGASRPAKVSFRSGVPTTIDLCMVPEAEVGDYVIVHSGYAISRLSPQVADKTLRLIDGREFQTG